MHDDFGVLNIWLTNSTILNTDVNRYHSFEVLWRHGYGNYAILIVRMAYNATTCNSNTIPSYPYSFVSGDHWHSDVITINPLSSLPYNITVTCPTGYQIDNLTGKCIQVPGDGYRTDGEKCDDNNTIDNDG